MPKPYDRGDPPQHVHDVLRFLREELTRIEAFTHYPQTDGSWDDFRFSANSVAAGATAPSWDTTNIGWAFSNVADNSVQGVGQLPHSWREGTNIRPHLHWEAGTGFSLGEAVVWTLGYRWRNNGETAGAMTLITMTSTPTATLALRVADFGEVAGTGKNISSIFEFEITRLAASSASDNLGATAILKEFDFHYMVDSLGSDLERKK